MTTIYLIRHAEAEGNIFRRLHGQYDSNVTANGLLQIRALAERFSDIPIDAVYASDLIRTQTTAAALYRPKNLPLHLDSRFREINVGIWEDTPFGQFDRVDHAGSYDFSHHPHRWHAEGSERFADYVGRFLSAMNEAADRHEGGTIAIFSHGMVLRGVLQSLFFPQNETAVPHSENTSVSRIFRENGRYSLDYLNDSSHISFEISTVGKQKWWRGDEKRSFNMWYRLAAPTDAPLLAELGFVPLPEQTVKISMLVDEPTGIVVTRQTGSAGQLDCFALRERFRGIGLAPQLLGEAICSLRANGAVHLTAATVPADPAAAHLLKKFDFAGNPPTLDLRPRIRAGEELDEHL